MLFGKAPTSFMIRSANCLVRAIISRSFMALLQSQIANPNSQIGNYFSSPLKYFSASIAAAQPEPAAVTACL